MPTGFRGQRVVVGLYLIIVAFSGVAGYATATIVDGITSPRFLFLIEFPATPLGLGAYGALTIGLVLGVLLVAVTVVSDRIDDATPGSTTAADSAVESTGSTEQPTESPTASSEPIEESTESTKNRDE